MGRWFNPLKISNLLLQIQETHEARLQHQLITQTSLSIQTVLKTEIHSIIRFLNIVNQCKINVRNKANVSEE